MCRRRREKNTITLQVSLFSSRQEFDRWGYSYLDSSSINKILLFSSVIIRGNFARWLWSGDIHRFFVAFHLWNEGRSSRDAQGFTVAIISSRAQCSRNFPRLHNYLWVRWQTHHRSLRTEAFKWQIWWINGGRGRLMKLFIHRMVTPEHEHVHTGLQNVQVTASSDSSMETWNTPFRVLCSKLACSRRATHVSITVFRLYTKQKLKLNLVKLWPRLKFDSDAQTASV